MASAKMASAAALLFARRANDKLPIKLARLPLLPIRGLPSDRGGGRLEATVGKLFRSPATPTTYVSTIARPSRRNQTSARTGRRADRASAAAYHAT